jgi:adenosine deaminase
MSQHSLKQLLEAGVCVTINSDDPAYFGGYMIENYVQTLEGLDLSTPQLVELIKNGFEASYLHKDDKARYMARIDELAGQALNA